VEGLVVRGVLERGGLHRRCGFSDRKEAVTQIGGKQLWLRKGASVAAGTESFLIENSSGKFLLCQ